MNDAALAARVLAGHGATVQYVTGYDVRVRWFSWRGPRTERPLAVSVTCRLDMAEKMSTDDVGGVLQRLAQDLLTRNFEEIRL